jgi:MioC protein
VKFEIVVGSVLGASEYVAEAIKAQLEERKHQVVIHFEPNVDEVNFNNILIVVTSTHGAGDLPDNIQAFQSQLAKRTLNDIPFIVIGLGDSSYDTFCQGAITMEDTLLKGGARRLHPPIHIDVLHHPIPEDEAVIFMQKVLTTL